MKEVIKKLVLRIPENLHKKATSHASQTCVSLNSFFISSITKALDTTDSTTDSTISSTTDSTTSGSHPAKEPKATKEVEEVPKEVPKEEDIEPTVSGVLSESTARTNQFNHDYSAEKCCACKKPAVNRKLVMGRPFFFCEKHS